MWKKPLIFFVFLCQISINDGNFQHQILKWWEGMSVQKPLKCQVNPSYLNRNPLSNENLIMHFVTNRKCREGESGYGASSVKSGKIADGLLHGTSKVILGKRSLTTKESNRTCFDVNFISGEKIEEVTGTFRDGQLEGTAKLKTKGMTTIGHFSHGLPYGVIRTWDASNKLVRIFFNEIKPKGMGWTLTASKFLAYQDVSYWPEDDVQDMHALLVPLNASETIMAGDLHTKIGALRNVKSVDIRKIVSDFCILQVEWKPMEPLGWDIVLADSFKMLHFNGEESVCKVTDSLSTASDQFSAFLGHLSKRNDRMKALHYLKPDVSPIDPERVAWPFISNYSLLNDSVVSMSIWNGPTHLWKASFIQLDKNKRLHGYCGLALDQKYFNQSGYMPQLKWSIQAMHGNFRHGNLNGLGVLSTWVGGLIYATFKDGVMHGPVASFGQFPLLDIEDRGFELNPAFRGQAIVDGPQFFGWFKNGQPFGDFWAAYYRSGFLHGRVNEKGQLTGDDYTFIFNDGETAFKGRFENKAMKKAQNVNILGYTCNSDGMFVPDKYSEPLSNRVFYHEPGTNISFGGGSIMDPDPYEDKYVELGQSSIPSSGEGVFAKRSLKKGMIACFFSLFLFRVPDQYEEYAKRYFNNKSKSDEYRRHCNKYTLEFTLFNGVHLLPPEMDVNPLPNFGPKVNHDFFKNNTKFILAEHPRWGLISSVTTSKDVQAGEELFAHYAYQKMDFPFDHPWYWEAKIKTDKENRLQKSKKPPKTKKRSRAA